MVDLVFVYLKRKMYTHICFPFCACLSFYNLTDKSARKKGVLYQQNLTVYFSKQLQQKSLNIELLNIAKSFNIKSEDPNNQLKILKLLLNSLKLVLFFFVGPLSLTVYFSKQLQQKSLNMWKTSFMVYCMKFREKKD
jgi:hypothetical protein